jgi:hypothetical protein
MNGKLELVVVPVSIPSADQREDAVTSARLVRQP